jgi:hypothetical protein
MLKLWVTVILIYRMDEQSIESEMTIVELLGKSSAHQDDYSRLKYLGLKFDP